MGLVVLLDLSGLLYLFSSQSPDADDRYTTLQNQYVTNCLSAYLSKDGTVNTVVLPYDVLGADPSSPDYARLLFDYCNQKFEYDLRENPFITPADFVF